MAVPCPARAVGKLVPGLRASKVLARVIRNNVYNMQCYHVNVSKHFSNDMDIKACFVTIFAMFAKSKNRY